MVGGPAPGLPRPGEGTVTVTGDGTSKSVRTGPNGLFTLVLPSGSYKVSGRLRSSDIPCSVTLLPNPTNPTKVVTQHTNLAYLFCSVP